MSPTVTHPKCTTVLDGGKGIVLEAATCINKGATTIVSPLNSATYNIAVQCCEVTDSGSKCVRYLDPNGAVSVAT